MGHTIALAVAEVLQNVVRHAYRPDELPGWLSLTLERQGDVLVVEVRDAARPVDPKTIRPRPWDPAKPGGLGLRLIHAAMDEVVHTPGPDGWGNVITLRKRLG